MKILNKLEKNKRRQKVWIIVLNFDTQASILSSILYFLIKYTEILICWSIQAKEKYHLIIV